MAAVSRAASVSSHGSVHSVSDSERQAYVDFLNQQLAQVPVLATRLPINPATQLCEAVKDGVIFVKLLNKFFPDTIDESKCSMKPKNQFEMSINLEAVIVGSKKIGCSVVNIGANDIMEGKEHLIMGLTWQQIKHSLMSLITKMDLSRLALDTNEVISAVPPEQMIMRWFNYHLKNAGHHRTVTNFAVDMQDSECYAFLLRQIAPDKISEKDLETALRVTDINRRAEIVLEWAERLGCRKFVTAKDIVEGNPRLNLAFVATLFQAYPSLGPTAEELALQKAGSLETQMKTLKIDFESLQFEKSEVEQELQAARDNYEIVANELRELYNQAAASQSEKEELLKCKLELEGQVTELTEKATHLNEMFEKLQLEKGEIERSLKEETSRRAELEEMNSQLESTIEEMEEGFRQEREKMEAEFEAKRQTFEREQAAMRQKLAAEIEQKEAALRELASKTEQWNQERSNYDDEIARLKRRIAELEEENARLRANLQSETSEKTTYESRLNEAEEILDRTVRENDEEKLSLLSRIRHLEEELDQLQDESTKKLRNAEIDKEDALKREAERRQRELLEAELKRFRDLDKVRLLLTGNQKQGWLMYQTTGLLGASWKSRFFVLKDHLLYWYKDEQSVTSTKPMGVLSCEEVRLYELDEKEAKRSYAFQIQVESGDKIKMNVSAQKLEDMKDWMTEIRLAKKKRLGVEAAAKQVHQAPGPGGN